MASSNGHRKLEPAEISALEAEAESHLAERDHFKALARKERALAVAAEIVANTKKREEKNELAKDAHHRVFVFDKPVTEASVKGAIQQMSAWARQDEGCAMELQINSPGGSIFDGFALIDFIRDLQCKGHEVTTVAFGMAASMGGVILQVGTRRVIGSNALLLIHEGSLGAIGDFGEVQDRVKLMELMHERILTLFEERAKPINQKTTKRYIRNHWERRDWWLTADDCLKLGFSTRFDRDERMPAAITTDQRLEIGAYIYGPDTKPVCHRIIRTTVHSASALHTKKVWVVEEISHPYARRRLYLKDIINDYRLARPAFLGFDTPGFDPALDTIQGAA